MLPREVAHSVRIPRDEARLIQVSVGAPYDGFARDMAASFAEGATLERIGEPPRIMGCRWVDPRGGQINEV
ncbi:MAG: hypothetical protein OEW66_09745 [Actinomycetota bacterium]|nr:hypothetical protein [Actinomycetota bacterium]